jgi:cation transport ATPase
LQSLPGVANVEINAEERTATVTVDPEKFKADAAVAALKESGFPANKAEDLSATGTEPAAAEPEAASEPESQS